MHHWDVEVLKNKAICYVCIGDEYLKKEIQTSGSQRKCLYCEATRRTFSLRDVSDLMEAAFERHYARTATDMDGFEYAMHRDPEIDYSWEREGEQTIYAIMNAADIAEEAAGHIQAILEDKHADFDAAAMGEETPFSSDAQYEEIMPTDAEWQEGWRAFERSIKTHARFFSRTAAQQLAELFDDIDQMRTRLGKSLIEDAGPGTGYTHFYRARVFQSDSKLIKALKRPDLELAAPPVGTASAGRMNAQGISTFYGATKPEIALAEVRPPVGSQVVIARFEITRTLRLLNLNSLKEVYEKGSIFDPQYANRLGRMMFLRSLSDRMARAVMPDDQVSEYLTTQAIADYLATEGKVLLDGILFPSVQAGGGLNAVLFFKASRCEEFQIPVGTELSASTVQDSSDGMERDYTVIERLRKAKPVEAECPTRAELFDFEWEASLPASSDQREITLRIDTAQIEVHIVEAAKFETLSHPVLRYRWGEEEHDF